MANKESTEEVTEEVGTLEQVLTIEYTRSDLGRRQVFASTVQPKQTSELLKQLQQPAYQFQELSHLKRVRKQADGSLVVLLFPKEHRNESQLYWCFFGCEAAAEDSASSSEPNPFRRFELKPLVVDVRTYLPTHVSKHPLDLIGTQSKRATVYEGAVRCLDFFMAILDTKIASVRVGFLLGLVTLVT